MSRLQERKRAGEGNRTLVSSLEGYSFTIKLHPRARLSCRASRRLPSVFLFLTRTRGRRGELIPAPFPVPAGMRSTRGDEQKERATAHPGGGFWHRRGRECFGIGRHETGRSG